MKNKKIVFIIGTGRSGTNFLARILEKSPELSASIESPIIFNLSSFLALNEDRKELFLPLLIWLYKIRLFFTSRNIYLDKSHPNIWHAIELSRSFNNSLFIGIQREPMATISSMLKHKGTLRWFNIWKRFSIPNRFLGINEEIKAEYERYPIEIKCALRWLSHKKQMDELKEKLGTRLIVINYENLIEAPTDDLEKLRKFIGLKQSTPKPFIKKDTLVKWKKNLNKKQISLISNFLLAHE